MKFLILLSCFMVIFDHVSSAAVATRSDATSDKPNGKLMALALSGLRIFLKSSLGSYNNKTEGVLFTVIDKAIPMDPAIEKLIAAGQEGGEKLAGAALDTIKASIENGSLDSLIGGKIQKQAIQEAEQNGDNKPELINALKQQLELVSSDKPSGQLVALALSGVKVFLKSSLEPYNDKTGGILFDVIDQIPTSGPVVDKLTAAGQQGAKKLAGAMLDTIKGISLDSVMREPSPGFDALSQFW